MKLSVGSKLVKQRIVDLIEVKDVNLSLCNTLLDYMFSSAPEIKAETIEQADELVRRVMDWQKGLPNMTVGQATLSFKELVVFGGLLQQRLDEMHLAVETLLFDLGVVERGTENTSAQDTE